MKFFSDELSLKAIIKNTQLGFRVLIDEWYWLLLQPFHTYKLNSLSKQINTCNDEENKNILISKKEELMQSYNAFRELQIKTRLNTYL